MEKRLKYLLGLLVVGVGLLFNQSFAGNTYLYVEGVTLPLLSSDFSSSSAYLYTFNNQTGWIESTNQSYPNLGYSLTYNGNTNYTYRPCFRSNGSCSSYTFNNSVFGPDLYQSRTGRSINGAWYYSRNQTRPGYNPIKVVLGAGDDFGKNFIYTNSVLNDNGVYTPHFMLGGGFLTSNIFVEKTAPNINYYLRLFFNQNVNLSSPLDGLNLAEGTGSNITGSIARQYFTTHGFVYQTKSNSTSKSFGDLGGSYTKKIHFGGYGMGYSFSLNTLGSSQIRRDDLNFASVGSRCVQSLMEVGMSDPNSGTSSGCQQLGLLVLKGESFVNSSNNASAIVLSKNPNNKRQILYQQFDCAEDDVSRLFNTDYCNTIGHGYITINGTGNILPNSAMYNIGSGNAFIDFMLQGDDYFGYVTISGNNYCLNKISSLGVNKSVCFGLTSTPQLTSIKSLYLNGGIAGIPAINNVGDITDQMILGCKGPYYNTPDGLPPAYCSILGTNFTGNFYQDIGVDSSGNIVVSIIQANPDDTYNFSNTTFTIDENGNYVATCSGDCYGSYIYYGHLDGVAPYSTGYFDQVLNNTGFYFQCPYAYTQKLIIGKKLISWLGGYDVFLPINCAIASFEHGKQVVFFGGTGLQFLSQPLLHGSGGNRDIIYKWLDFILILGLLFLFSRIYKGFNH